MALDLYSTVRVAAPLLGLLALHKLQVLRLPLVELSDCEVCQRVMFIAELR